MRGGFLPVIISGLTPIIVLALLVTGIGLNLVQWQPPALWTTQFGTPGNNVRNAVTVVSADTTGLYAGGYVGFTYLGGVNPSPSNLFVSRYDPTGRQVWTQQFADPLVSVIRGIAIAGDGVYIAGSVNVSGLVRKYDLNGNQVWTSPFGREAASVSVGTNGVYAAGFNYFAANSTDAVILRSYDFNGNTVWTHALGNSLAPSALTVYSSTNGIYIAGTLSSAGFLGSYDFSGALKWTRQFTCNCAPSGVSADSTGIYVAGYSSQGGGVTNGFLSKYDWNGNQLWTRNLDPPDYTSVAIFQMSVNPSGIYLAMTTVRSGFLMRYDGNGNQAWSFHMQRRLNTVSAGQNSVYVGGKDSFGDNAEGNAFITEFSQSSSLILFGLNPPYSFGLVSLLAGLTALSILWRRRERKKKVRPPSANRNYESRGRQGTQPTRSRVALSLR